MKNRVIVIGYVATLLAGYAAGMATNDSSVATAQAPVPPGAYPSYPGGVLPSTQEKGKAMFWSAEDIKKRFVDQKESSNTLTWSPEYRLTLMKRDSPQATSEMHDDMTQIYWMVGGTGAVALGGEPEKKTQRWAGQWSGEGPLKGAKTQKVKAGDLVAIPPGAWHQAQPDQGGFSYVMCHVRTPTLIP